MARQISIIIPTRNRARALEKLLASIAQLDGLADVHPEIVIADNDSHDDTQTCVAAIARSFPCHVRTVEVPRPGKSAAINDALRVSCGVTLAFLDDDVVVGNDWLVHIERFCREERYKAGQGRILLQSPEGEDPAIQRLMQRYRTIPYLNLGAEIKNVHSLNGANFIIKRDLLNDLGGFDERLGPGASGTSEDVELSRRIRNAGYGIGYIREATVYHSVDRSRFTEEYFRSLHRRQGYSRLIMKPRSKLRILCSLGRVLLQHANAKIRGSERKLYRSKGRIQHYLGMLEAKREARALRRRSQDMPPLPAPTSNARSERAPDAALS